MLRLDNLKPAPGSKKRRKRVGRGPGSGHGKTSCRGHKGQNARSGGGVPPYFEGGQMPLTRRIPKRGFTNALFKKRYAVVNIRDLVRWFSEGDEVNPEILREKGYVKKKLPIKILGDGDIDFPLVVKAHKFSESAKRKIEEAGGKAEVIS